MFPQKRSLKGARITWPLRKRAGMNPADLRRDAGVLYFCSTLSTLEGRLNQFCKGAQRWARIWLHREGLQVESCVPLIDLSGAGSARPAPPTCRTLISHLFSIRGGTLNHLGSLSRSSFCQTPPQLAALPGGVGWEVGEASVGKTSLGMRGAPTVAAGLFGAVDWRIQVLVPQDVVGTGKTWVALFTSLVLR